VTFLCLSEIIRSFLGTQVLRATSKFFERYKAVFQMRREENADSQNYVVGKGIRSDKALY